MWKIIIDFLSTSQERPYPELPMLRDEFKAYGTTDSLWGTGDSNYAALKKFFFVLRNAEAAYLSPLPKYLCSRNDCPALLAYVS